MIHTPINAPQKPEQVCGSAGYRGFQRVGQTLWSFAGVRGEPIERVSLAAMVASFLFVKKGGACAA